MKKCIVILLCLALLTGCSAVQTFETLGNVDHQSQTPPALKQILLELPKDAAVLSSVSDGDMLYACEGYTLAVQTLPAGDLHATIQTISGFSPGQLTVMESACGNHDRYDWVWTAAGENGDAVCRAAVLSDGNYHYSLTAIASAESAGQLTDTWNALFGSFCLKS